MTDQISSKDVIELTPRREAEAKRKDEELRSRLDVVLNQIHQNADMRAALEGGARLRQLADELLKMLIRDGHDCDHITIRPGWLPCPHPDCWTTENPWMQQLCCFEKAIMRGATAKRGTHGLRKRCPICRKLRKFREPHGNQGGEVHPRRKSWRKLDGRWVCGLCVNRTTSLNELVINSVRPEAE